MTTSHVAICLLCFSQIEAQTSYGICPNCYNSSNLREFDRWDIAVHSHRHRHLPHSLTLPEWLTILSDYHGMCALCLVSHFDRIEVFAESKGLVKGNVLPVCRSCYTMRRNTWEKAIVRVQKYLNGEQVDVIAAKFPVFDESEVE